MKTNPTQRSAFRLSLTISSLVVLFFLIVTLITGNAGFMLWSLLPAFITTITGYAQDKNVRRKAGIR
ncbi:hypothetical protein N6H14_03920 [Paenibacillus sp. CC-CFT747]|nr:hypothetical protein N6H14_03920 [Paenibacillus sp. CC-CFT747]